MFLAQVDIGKTWPLAKPPEFQTLGGMVSFLLPKILLLGGIIFFILVIAAGFSILSGAGSEEPEAKGKWRQILTFAIVGLIIIFGAYWVLQIINFITGGALKGML